MEGRRRTKTVTEPCSRARIKRKLRTERRAERDPAARWAEIKAKLLTRRVLRPAIVVCLAILVITPASVADNDEYSPAVLIQRTFARISEFAEQSMAVFSPKENISKTLVSGPPKPSYMVINPKTNEEIVWNFLLDNGFSLEQTAGIMGNLAQEHHFRTSGDGLAQWTQGRKRELQSWHDHGSLDTQLNFMMYELNGRYKYARDAVLSSKTVAEATRNFMLLYERPGIPAENRRLYYAQEIYARYTATPHFIDAELPDWSVDS